MALIARRKRVVVADDGLHEVGEHDEGGVPRGENVSLALGGLANVDADPASVGKDQRSGAPAAVVREVGANKHHHFLHLHGFAKIHPPPEIGALFGTPGGEFRPVALDEFPHSPNPSTSPCWSKDTPHSITPPHTGQPTMTAHWQTPAFAMDKCADAPCQNTNDKSPSNDPASPSHTDPNNHDN